MNVYELREDDKKTVFREVLSRSVFSKNYKNENIGETLLCAQCKLFSINVRSSC